MFVYICTYYLINKTNLQKMESVNNTETAGFLAAYEMLPAGIQSKVRERIQKECDWRSDFTFYGKVKGTARIKNPEWKVLEEIFADYGIDAHTGKTYQPSIQ